MRVAGCYTMRDPPHRPSGALHSYIHWNLKGSEASDFMRKTQKLDSLKLPLPVACSLTLFSLWYIMMVTHPLNPTYSNWLLGPRA